MLSEKPKVKKSGCTDVCRETGLNSSQKKLYLCLKNNIPEMRKSHMCFHWNKIQKITIKIVFLANKNRKLCCQFFQIFNFFNFLYFAYFSWIFLGIFLVVILLPRILAFLLIFPWFLLDFSWWSFWILEFF